FLHGICRTEKLVENSAVVVFGAAGPDTAALVYTPGDKPAYHCHHGTHPVTFWHGRYLPDLSGFLGDGSPADESKVSFRCIPVLGRLALQLFVFSVHAPPGCLSPTCWYRRSPLFGTVIDNM